MVKGYPTFVAIRHRGAGEPRLFCEVLSLTKKQGLRVRVINGAFECLLREDVLTVLPTREQFPGQELLDLSNLPASEGGNYTRALAWVAAHPEDFPVIPGPKKPQPPETHDDRIYRQFHAFPKTEPYTIDHILATDLQVPVTDLIAALQRHGFASEPAEYEVDGKRIPYLKLSRPDGAEFSFDWNGAGSNFYDGYDVSEDPAQITEAAELRMLPYALESIGFFCAIWWTRKVVPGEIIPRYTMAWPLMDSAGPEDMSPSRKEVMAEHAEKKRRAGLDEENKKLKETLERLRAALPRISQNQLLRSTESTPCCGEVPWLDTWDANESRSVHCLICGRHTDSYFMRNAALEAWEQLFK